MLSEERISTTTPRSRRSTDKDSTSDILGTPHIVTGPFANIAAGISATVAFLIR